MVFAQNQVRKWSLRRIAACVAASVGALILVAAVFLFAFSGSILNGYAKAKVERAFAQAHPGCTVQLGELDYAVAANRLVAQSVTLTVTNTILTAGRISLSGVHWARLLRGSVVLAEALAQASLEATNIDVEFPQAQYRIRCARLRASVPSSDFIAEGTELSPLKGDGEFFAAHAFQTPRFRVVLPECKVSGLAFGALLQGKAYRARSVHFSRPTFEALINRDKARAPFVKSPLMVHEALAAIPQPLEIGTLSLTNGNLRYCERLTVGADPGVLTIGAVSLSVEGIANRGDRTAAIHLQGQGDLMGGGMMNVLMTIPIISTNFSLHYSGSLGAMELARLDAFLEIAEHTRIKSGRAQEAAFEIDVISGHARGRVRAIYRDLDIALLDKRTGTETGLAHRFASFLTNALKLRKANTPEPSGSWKVGKVDYRRKPDEPFQQFVWFALRTGVLDIITH